MSRQDLVPAAERPAWRERLLMKAGVAAGVVAVAASAATAKPRPAQASAEGYGIGLVGFTDESIFSKDLSQSEAVALKIKQMGGTAVRFFYIINKNTAWQNYKTETCNAFQAAHDNELQPIVALEGYDSDPGYSEPGYIPATPTDIKKATTTAASILWTVGSNTGGCVPQQKYFIFEGMNEINNNNPEFNSSYGSQTPIQAARLDYALSTTLRKEAAKPQIDATVSFGESLADSTHSPVQFLDSEGQAANTLGLNLKYDFIDIHPYPTDPTADPSITMRQLQGPATQAINTYFPGAKLTFGEIGNNTINPPSLLANEYSPPVSSSVGISEATQVKYDTDILSEAATDGAPFVTFMDLQDDGSGNMPASGVFYAGGSIANALPKSSKAGIRYQIGKYTGR